jgi:SAM-dependent methyltransferase
MQDQEHLYSDYADVHDGILKDCSQETFQRNALEYARLHGRFLPQSRDSRILDAGCGTGSFLYYLKEQGYRHYFGIDWSAKNIDFVHRHVTDRCEQGDMVPYLRANENSFDAVVMNEVLEHISKPAAIDVLKAVWNSLRTNGVILILVPNMENPATVYTRWHDFTHETGYTQNSLRMVLRMVGFDDVAVYGAGDFAKPSLKRFFANIVRSVTRVYIRAVFGYPKTGILFSKRILAVARKHPT